MTAFDPPPPPPDTDFPSAETPPLPPSSESQPTAETPTPWAENQPKSRSKLIVATALTVFLVIALVTVSTVFIMKRNLNAAVEEATAELQSNLKVAGDAQVKLTASLETLELESLRLKAVEADGPESARDSAAGTTSTGKSASAYDDIREDESPLNARSTALQVDGQIVKHAEEELTTLTQTISKGEALMARANDPREAKRPLLEENKRSQ